MTVEDLTKQLMFLLEQGKGHYNIYITTETKLADTQSFELNDDYEGVIIY